MSDTPRTDEYYANLHGCCQPETHADSMADFSRTLERELAEKDRKIAALQSAVNLALDALDRSRK